MGWSSIAKPGDEFGPCKTECRHVDCAAARKEAEAVCITCGEPIGYETPRYGLVSRGDQEHARCAWKRIDEETRNPWEGVRP